MHGLTGRGGLLCSHLQLGKAHCLCGKLYPCSSLRIGAGEREEGRERKRDREREGKKEGERNMRRKRKSESWGETSREWETINPNCSLSI